MKTMNGSLRNGILGTDFYLDVIDEFVVENMKLPGPPSPPDDPDTSVLFQRSAPVLVSRSTAPQHQTMFNPGNMPIHPLARGSKGQRRSLAQPTASIVSSHHMGTEQLERLLEKPELLVVEQPKERGMRFRYECEGRSAGSILGASSTDVNKTVPAIEIRGPIEGIKNVTVTVSLVTKDIPHRPHPHCLVGKDCLDGVCVISFNPHITRRHSFVNLGIQCVRRKELDASLMKRKKKNIDPFNTGHSKSIEDMDMNVVKLCFQCELEREDGDRIHLGPVVSNPIYDKKATTTAELKINRLNIVRGPCIGKTEIYMLCDKVQKDDIEIIFCLDNWEAKAEFAQTDVHRQIAIVFKSPPYQEQHISEEVEVNVRLRRISDHMYSESVKFTYTPNNSDPYDVNRKRKIIDSPVVDADMIPNTAMASHQFEQFCFSPLEPPLPIQEAAQVSVPQLLDEIHYGEDDLKVEDSCVSLDPDTMHSIMLSLKECLGSQNFLQLLTSQDLNSNIADTNMNIPDLSQPAANAASFNDPFSDLPHDLQDIFLRQVKTESEDDS